MKKVLLLAALPLFALAACEDDPAPVVVNSGNVVVPVDVDCATAPKTDTRCYYADGTAK